MEKFQIDTPEMKPKSKETNAQQKIADSVDAYPETGGVSIDEAKKKEGEIKIAKVQNEIKQKFPTDEPEPEAKQVVTVELPPNTPAIFQKMPEIAKYVSAYMEDYNRRKEAKGLKKLMNFFTQDEDELKKFEAAGKKALKFEYAKALSPDGKTQNPEAAWRYVKELIDVKYVKVNDSGDIEHKGKFRVAAGEESALKGGQ